MANLLLGPDSAQMASIAAEIGEEPGKLQNNVQLLRQWVACQPHLPQDYDNNLLPVFIRGCKHNLERAKKKMEMYFIARAKIPEIFADREPTAHLLERYKSMIKIGVLSKLTPAGYRVTIYKVVPGNLDEWSIKDVVRYAFMIGDIRVSQETALAGDIFMFDLQNLKLGYLLKFVTPVLRKAMVAAHEAFPQRLHKFHLVNSPAFIEKFLSAIRPWFKEKIRNRFEVHSGLQGLTDFIPADVLPEEYGGTAGKFEDVVEDWSHCLIQHKKWFQQQDNVKVVGPIPERVSTSQFDDIIGLEGSFRKLEVD